MNRWELEHKIIMKALKDPEFKKKLLSQPKEALKDFLQSEGNEDLNIPDKMNVKVYEEKQDEWMISLPHLTKDAQQLSTAELEKLFAAGASGSVCGGGGMTWCSMNC